VDLVADLDDRTGVDTHVLADSGEVLQPSNPVVHIAEPDRLGRQVPRNLHDMEEAQLRVLRAGDPGAEFHERLVLELPERKEHAVSLELHMVFRRREDIPNLRTRGSRSQTTRGVASAEPVIREPDREPYAAEQCGEHPRRQGGVTPRGIIPQERTESEI